MIKKFSAYFAAKSVKQRIGVIIAFVLLLIFAVFFIKGNFFDKAYESGPQTSASDTLPNEDSAADNSDTATEKSGDIKFHISFIDVGILLVVITFFVIRKIREKQTHRRM